MTYQPIKSLLIANRSEIAIRVMRAAAEMNIHTVAIYSREDRLALHRFKADESYLVGEGKKPLAAYLDIDDILRVAKETQVDAIHPGYGFLSENPDFAQAVIDAGIRWIGPSPEVMRTLGNKIAARNAAVAAGVPVMPATRPLPEDLETCKQLAAEVGYPLMLKASWGGGGRGMRVLESERDLEPSLSAARREALAAFGNDEVYFENWCAARAMWKCRFWATPPVMWCTCSSATAPCNGATRKWSNARPRPTSTAPRARRCAMPRCA